MNIVYGVSGEGLGHVMEAAEIAAVLLREGHRLKVLTYGERALSELRGLRPTRIEGLPLHFNARGLSVGATLARNAHCVPFYMRNWGRLRREIEAFEPDVFLTAYEPFSTVLAHVLRKPLVSMDNQNALRFLPRAPRGHRAAFFLAKLATRVVTHGADAYLVKTLRPPRGAPPRVRFVAPVVQAALRGLAPETGRHVLVYLTKPNPELLRVLRAVDQPFRVYSDGCSGSDGNLEFRPRGGGFLRDLAECRAVVGTAGFSLIADAVYLKKPYFAVPLKKQFEQTLNGLFLVESGLGESAEHPGPEELRRFLGSLPRYRERLSGHRFDPAEQEEALIEVLRGLASLAPELTAASPAFSAK